MIALAPELLDVLVLQLGHAGEGVEMGNNCSYCRKLQRLQLGHAGEGVEITRTRPCLVTGARLQLGHAGEGVEMAKKKYVLRVKRSFNWATPVKAWRYD